VLVDIGVVDAYRQPAVVAAAVLVTLGIGWSAELWTGTIAWACLLGLALSLLMLPPPTPVRRRADRSCATAVPTPRRRRFVHSYAAARLGSSSCWPLPLATIPPGQEGGLMPIQLNHTIVSVRDKRESATFLAEILGVGPPTPYGPFLVVQVDNDVSLDFADDHGPVHPQHYAFLVGESEFDQIFGRIRERGLPYWADPGRRRPSEFNTNDGGRGVYWEDPSGHFLEIITRPYGSGS
jgi:catechol 2,3-dioxygenase-like lactoylglutathione lyase family enzyme